jgi:extracellular matrix regulatory protein B
MYIHVGEDVMVKTDEIVAIIDKDTVQFSEEMQLFLKKKEKQTSNLAKGTYKSLVVTVDQLYLSPLASATLKKRSKKWNTHDNLLNR